MLGVGFSPPAVGFSPVGHSPRPVSLWRVSHLCAYPVCNFVSACLARTTLARVFLLWRTCLSKVFFCVTLTHFSFLCWSSMQFRFCEGQLARTNFGAYLFFLYFPFCEEVLSTPVWRVLHVDPICTFPSAKESIWRARISFCVFFFLRRSFVYRGVRQFDAFLYGAYICLRIFPFVHRIVCVISGRPIMDKLTSRNPALFAIFASYCNNSS